MKTLQESVDGLTKENLELKEKEQMAENREGILASSLERAQEFENLMDGVENGEKSLIDLEDDPLISLEDLRNRVEGRTDEEEDFSDIMSEGNDEMAGTPKRRREKVSPESGESNKKVRGRTRQIYDGHGNFVKIPLIVERKEKTLVKEGGGDSKKSKETMANNRQYLLRSDVPPPVPPRPPSRSHSTGPPASRDSSVTGVIVTGPLSRRGSTEAITGFDETSKEWIPSQGNTL